MQIVSIGDILHEMSKPVIWNENKKIFQFIVCKKFTAKQSFQYTVIWKTNYFSVRLISFKYAKYRLKQRNTLFTKKIPTCALLK